MRTAVAILRFLCLPTLMTLPVAAADRDSWPEAVLKLKPPFAISAPPAPPSTYGKIDLLDVDKTRALARTADDIARAGQIEDAIKIRYWYIVGAPDAWGRPNLAALYAATRRTEAAVYWLQRAAIEEGLPPEEIKDYPAFEPLTASPDWPKLNEFLTAAAQAWNQSNFRRDILLTPRGYEVGKPLPVIIILHGHRSGPESFVRERAAMQKMCDELHLAVLSISGPMVFGPHSFAWPVDLRPVYQRVEEALNSTKSKLTPDPVRLMMVGFSAGAQAAVEIAAYDPKHFLGAMGMSPGRSTGDRIVKNLKPDMLVGRRFLIINGSKEDPSFHAVGDMDTQALKNAGAKALHETVPNMAHQVPANYEALLHDWAKLLLEMDGKP